VLTDCLIDDDNARDRVVVVLSRTENASEAFAIPSF